MKFEVHGQQYKASFKYSTDTTRGKVRETGECIMHKLTGELGEQVAYVYCGPFKSGSNRRKMRRKLLAIAIQIAVPPTEKIQWEEKHIVVPPKVREKGESLVQKYIAYKLEQVKSEKMVRRSYQDAWKRWDFWYAICAVHPSTVKKLSSGPKGRSGTTVFNG